MEKETSLRKKFFDLVKNKWYCKNTYDSNYKEPPARPGVYFFASLDPCTMHLEIVYIGSSTNLSQRYGVHRIPNLIENETPKKYSIFYFKPMKTGFYDYEMKLIKKLKPKYNKLTYC